MKVSWKKPWTKELPLLGQNAQRDWGGIIITLVGGTTELRSGPETAGIDIPHLGKRLGRSGNTDLWEGGNRLLESMSLTDGMIQLRLQTLEKLSTGFSCCDVAEVKNCWSDAHWNCKSRRSPQEGEREKKPPIPRLPTSSLVVSHKQTLLPKPNTVSWQSEMLLAKFQLQPHKKDREGWVWCRDKVA